MPKIAKPAPVAKETAEPIEIATPAKPEPVVQPVPAEIPWHTYKALEQEPPADLQAPDWTGIDPPAQPGTHELERKSPEEVERARVEEVHRRLARFRAQREAGCVDRRLRAFFEQAGLQILTADDQQKELAAFLGQPGPGRKESPEWRDLEIAVAVEKLIAAGASAEDAITAVAQTPPIRSRSRVKAIYYKNRRAAKIDLAM
ncbi:unnamed protein product [uncultured bacterium]|nr:unnamed protein product [uncultured bacterium]